jgi:hypothetical protein
MPPDHDYFNGSVANWIFCQVRKFPQLVPSHPAAQARGTT